VLPGRKVVLSEWSKPSTVHEKGVERLEHEGERYASREIICHSVPIFLIHVQLRNRVFPVSGGFSAFILPQPTDHLVSDGQNI